MMCDMKCDISKALWRGIFRTIKRILLPLMAIVSILYITDHLPNYFSIFTILNEHATKNQERTDVPSCKLVQLKLNDPEIEQFFKKRDPLHCNNSERDWVRSVEGKFYIEQWAIEKHGKIECDYYHISRLPGDHEFVYEKLPNFQNGSEILNDFFAVNCKAKDKSKFKNIIATIKPVAELKNNRLNNSNFNGLNLNVYMLGFDSVSRMMFMRKLPKTYEFLTKTLKATVLEGYNVVGDGTPQALLPIFTGKTELEMPLTRKRYENANWVNVYPFVWNQFRENGYITLYGEDTPDFGAFQYRLKGFNEQPTDHYLRTFYLAVQKHDYAKDYCIGNEPHHKVHFRYSEDLFRNYPKSTRKFAFTFHAKMSHDDVNLIQIVDDDMADHLKFFHENNYLNDTILIFMSDHGHRFDKLRQTQQGKLEERLPFFSIVMPPWFKEAYPKAWENLNINAKRLTSPFDIYPTLKSVLNFNYPPKMGNVRDRGISLFEEVPSSRSCKDADIALHWCACLDWKPCSVQDERVISIADKIVTLINAHTEPERKLCAKLELGKIERALIYKFNADFINFKKAKDKDGFVPDFTGNMNITSDYFQVTFRTQPGNALYEASVTWDKNLQHMRDINLEEISRINKYGDLPHCVAERDYFQAKWCVCYDKI